MPCFILRKVSYRLPGTNRLVWAVVLAENEGLSLLFVQKPDGQRSHAIAIAAENVGEHVYEEVKASRFHLENEDLAGIGGKLQALGENLYEPDFRRLFDSEDRW